MLKFLKARVTLPAYMHHFKKGGHVAALHSHLNSKFFFKIDIQNFYYSIACMRVTRALRDYGYPGAGTFSKWSCVANPGPGPKYALPIGFVQSPMLASLVLMKSDVAGAIQRGIDNGIFISVYLDDFIGSHDDEEKLIAAYSDIRDTCVTAGFIPNPEKLTPPASAITAFNCQLTRGSASVSPDRAAKYFMSPNRTAMSDAGFNNYCGLVASRNI